MRSSSARSAARVCFVIVMVFAVSVAVWGFFLPLPAAPGRTYTDADFRIAELAEGHDEDGDGIGDQADILAGARAYVATRPRYGSAYYQGGRPDDGRGVCTDVVDQALLAAGYDLQTLVDTDRRANPADYGMDPIDSNVDFRRVHNVRVYLEHTADLEHTAEGLTCDPAQIDQWQGGDIVVWNDHVGIVSDRRDADGVCYVIHHAGLLQLCYEEDVLESDTFGPIVGHYRMTA